MKLAALVRTFKNYEKDIEHTVICTGQHYSYEMSKQFFKDLTLDAPDYNLQVGSGTHGYQTALMLERIEKVLLKEKPDIVIVYGDTNSTLAGALAAVKLYIPVAHVEAGLRSFDREMPEEINRIVTDILSDYLFTTCQEANDNLEQEGISKNKIFFVGNVMIDTLRCMEQKIKKLITNTNLGLKSKNYAVLTLHRPENVDNKEVFGEIIEALIEIQKKIKIVFPVHPRTKKQIKNFGFQKYFQNLNENNKEVRGSNPEDTSCGQRILCIDPMGYLEFLNLVINSNFVLSDSGGLQEETTALSIPCLTLRKNTERPITVSSGTNTIVGIKKKKIIREAYKILEGSVKKCSVPKLWDGKAAERIVESLFSM
jgi:UDP-N-acetylglucosamine 2-epimerase (non-hydrolysing)